MFVYSSRNTYPFSYIIQKITYINPFTAHMLVLFNNIQLYSVVLTKNLCTSRLKSTKRRRSLRACYCNFKLDFTSEVINARILSTYCNKLCQLMVSRGKNKITRASIHECVRCRRRIFRFMNIS